MTRRSINIADVTLQPRPAPMTPKGEAAERFDCRMGPIAPLLGAEKLGYNITAVPPGKRAFPLHNHRVNEEMFFILEGTGEARIGDEVFAVKPGDIVACPPGGPERAHQLTNTGLVELRYLAVSTKVTPEIVEYPDSGKFGVLGEFRSSQGEAKTFRFVGREAQCLDYWEGE
jgi:uncharacterized cupin superfamily protein